MNIASVNVVAVCPYLHKVLVDPFCEGLFLNSVPFICDRYKKKQRLILFIQLIHIT